MNPNDKKWPGIAIPEDDRDLINRISQQDGVLTGIDAKDLLMIAASLAVKSRAPEVVPPTSRNIDTISPGNLNTYNEYRQYISLIYYQTAGNHDLNSMSDPKVMIGNFIDYARRGLQMLKTNYLEAPDGNEKMEEKFVEYLSGATK